MEGGAVYSWQRSDGTRWVALAGALPSLEQLTTVEFDPISDEPGLARPEVADRDVSSADVHDRPMLGRPGVDVWRTVVADLHVDDDPVEGGDARHQPLKVPASCDAAPGPRLRGEIEHRFACRRWKSPPSDTPLR